MDYKVAKITLAMFPDREFDYSLPPSVSALIGVRVLVDFRGRKTVGIITSFAKESNFATLKPILEILDSKQLLGLEHRDFARALTKIYPYPEGEFLFMMLPAYLRKNKKTSISAISQIETGVHPVAKKTFV
ncbi:MAG: hypothetical protein PHQ96_09800, partial [Candidatus Omnitrophica bacterium]|nr:hypothetical protein [Candidatus Omnitrophota bacterium]